MMAGSGDRIEAEAAPASLRVLPHPPARAHPAACDSSGRASRRSLSRLPRWASPGNGSRPVGRMVGAGWWAGWLRPVAAMAGAAERGDAADRS